VDRTTVGKRKRGPPTTWWGRFKVESKAALIAAVLLLLRRTWRVRHVERPWSDRPAEPTVLAHWHGDEVLVAGAYTGSGIVVMTSTSRDGELLSRILRRMGFGTVRGSSSQGGVAGLKAIIERVKVHGDSAALAVDGPRGPIYELKPGVIKMAQETGRLLVVGACAAARRFVLERAWDRTYVPLPFTRCVIVYAGPRRVPRELDDRQLEELRLEIQQELRRCKAEAEACFGRTVPELARSTAETQLPQPGVSRS
jgi:lysophospholipid acyltransferase (LPLAT)-like uncharacterized protein